jgi:hypothetical protein
MKKSFLFGFIFSVFVSCQVDAQSHFNVAIATVSSYSATIILSESSMISDWESVVESGGITAGIDTVWIDTVHVDVSTWGWSIFARDSTGLVRSVVDLVDDNDTLYERQFGNDTKTVTCKGCFDACYLKKYPEPAGWSCYPDCDPGKPECIKTETVVINDNIFKG